MLIGKPDPREGDDKIETLLEQLRQRQLSTEQVETYDRQRIAAEKRRVLLEAEAQADMQTKLTNARVNVQVAESHGEAELAVARKKAEQTIVVADAELARSRREAEQTVVLAEASAQRDQLAGRGESQKIAQVGLAEASVLLRQIASYGDPRLYALSRVSENLSNSAQPLVPERMFVAGGSADGNGNGSSFAADEWFARRVDQPVGRRKIRLPIGHRQPRDEGPAIARRKARGRRGAERQAAGETSGKCKVVANSVRSPRVR